jgi:hypothetical protein
MQWTPSTSTITYMEDSWGGCATCRYVRGGTAVGTGSGTGGIMASGKLKLGLVVWSHLIVMHVPSRTPIDRRIGLFGQTRGGSK